MHHQQGGYQRHQRRPQFLNWTAHIETKNVSRTNHSSKSGQNMTIITKPKRQFLNITSNPLKAHLAKSLIENINYNQAHKSTTFECHEEAGGPFCAVPFKNCFDCFLKEKQSGKSTDSGRSIQDSCCNTPINQLVVLESFLERLEHTEKQEDEPF